MEQPILDSASQAGETPLTKNSLFAGHDEGAANWACIASLIETCKINGVDPLAYLVATLEAIAAGHPQSRIDELTPWAFAAASSRKL